MAALRVVLDTNVLLSGIAYPASVPGKILTAWRHASIEVLLSDYILDELRRVLPRLAHRHGLTVAEMSDLVDILAIQAELIAPWPGWTRTCATTRINRCCTLCWPLSRRLVLTTSSRETKTFWRWLIDIL
jgi:probable toxin-antitoxin system toxin component, PIN family